MSDHVGFTREEATTTEAGRIRGVILGTIAMRVGQVPDVHPRLLEGIEVAARQLADDREAVAVLADEWEAAATKPKPEKSPGESDRDYGVRLGVWNAVRTAAADLCAAVSLDGGGA